ncbi:MAG: hypothetical protein ACK59A_06640, partial [Cyanobacteriota bacterium]
VGPTAAAPAAPPRPPPNEGPPHVAPGDNPAPERPRPVPLAAPPGGAVLARGLTAGACLGGGARRGGGGGGGRPHLAQAGGKDGAALGGALAQARQDLQQELSA